MGFPINTAGQIYNVWKVRQLYEFQSKEDYAAGKKRQPKTDGDGNPIYAVEVPFSEVQMTLEIRVAGDPGVKKGDTVRIEGLTINPYRLERNNRTFEGVTYRAERIIPANAAGKAA